MARLIDYPNICAHKKRSSLPVHLQETIISLMDDVRTGRDISEPLEAYADAVGLLPASSINRAMRDIRHAGRLLRHAPKESLKQRLQYLWYWIRTAQFKNALYTFNRHSQKIATARSEVLALEKQQRLCRLYIFHGDGHMREAALTAWTGPIDSPFIFTAWVYLLNDWCEPVRDAAYRRARELFPQMPANVIASAAFYLFAQIPKLERWGFDERTYIESAMYRQDVKEAFEKQLMQRPAGHVSLIFRHALKRPEFDGRLPEFATHAALPHVRAIAYECLLLRRARWREGFRYQWIDKSHGLRQRVPNFVERKIEHQLDLEELLRQGAHDHAVVVRKVIASTLIKLRTELSSEMREIGEVLAQDRSKSVRSKAEFFLSKLS